MKKTLYILGFIALLFGMLLGAFLTKDLYRVLLSIGVIFWTYAAVASFPAFLKKIEVQEYAKNRKTSKDETDKLITEAKQTFNAMEVADVLKDIDYFERAELLAELYRAYSDMYLCRENIISGYDAYNATKLSSFLPKCANDIRKYADEIKQISRKICKIDGQVKITISNALLCKDSKTITAKQAIIGATLRSNNYDTAIAAFNNAIVKRLPAMVKSVDDAVKGYSYSGEISNEEFLHMRVQFHGEVFTEQMQCNYFNGAINDGNSPLKAMEGSLEHKVSPGALHRMRNDLKSLENKQSD